MDQRDLFRLSAESLYALELSELRPLLCEELSDASLRRIDRILAHRLLHLMRSQPDADDARQAHSDLRRLVAPSRRAAIEPWPTRWRALADLLDLYLKQLALRAPDQARRLAHAEEILREVRREPGIRQSKLAGTVGLKAANASRVLSALESHGLVVRRRTGNAKEVFPGPALGQPLLLTCERRAVANNSKGFEAIGHDADLKTG